MTNDKTPSSRPSRLIFDAEGTWYVAKHEYTTASGDLASLTVAQVRTALMTNPVWQQRFVDLMSEVMIAALVEQPWRDAAAWARGGWGTGEEG